MDWLKETLDNCFKNMISQEYQMETCAKIPIEMLADDADIRKEWKTWKPIDSIIDDECLNNLQEELNYMLPKTYKEFLKYKHFVELSINDFSVNFPKHLPDKSLKDLKQKAYDFYEPGYLLEQKLFYFADFQDYGLLCFDATVQKPDNEFKIVFIDHEDIDTKFNYAENFRELLLGDKEKGNRFIVDVLNKRNI